MERWSWKRKAQIVEDVRDRKLKLTVVLGVHGISYEEYQRWVELYDANGGAKGLRNEQIQEYRRTNDQGKRGAPRSLDPDPPVRPAAERLRHAGLDGPKNPGRAPSRLDLPRRGHRRRLPTND